MSVEEFIAKGLDPAKPFVSIDASSTGTRLSTFFRSLRSEKTEAARSVKLVWVTDPFDPGARRASARIFVESMTQVYWTWFDPEPTLVTPGKRHFAELADWSVTGRIAEYGKPFDPSPEAGCTRVCGYIEMTMFGDERIETIYLQVTAGSIELPGARLAYEWDTVS
jgi:hypothetical protein